MVSTQRAVKPLHVVLREHPPQIHEMIMWSKRCLQRLIDEPDHHASPDPWFVATNDDAHGAKMIHEAVSSKRSLANTNDAFDVIATID